MQVSIEQKINEVTIDHKLAALREISEQKDSVDKQLSDLNLYAGETFVITQIVFEKSPKGFSKDIKNRLEFDLPDVPSRMIVKIIENYLKQRREELIAHAQQLMK